jgi:hypothetical protein
MALVPTEQLSAPAFSSTLIIGSSGTGKTASIGTLHRYLRQHKLPTTIVYFDFDQDGAEPVLRMARDGYESIDDMKRKVARIEPWLGDLVLYRYYTKNRRMADQVAPHRDRELVLEFLKDFNTLDNRCEPGQPIRWKPDQAIGAIIYDPLTTIQEMYEDFIWKTRGKEFGELGTNGITFTDWNLLGEKVRDAYKLAKVFPCYFVAMAHLDQRLEDVRVPEGQQKITTGKWFYTAALVKAVSMTIQKDFSTTVFTTEDFKWIVKPNEHNRGARARGKDFTTDKVDQDFANILDD